LAGGTIEVGLANGWSVESGVQYSMKGWRRIDPQSNDRADVNIDYIEVPVQLRYEIRNTSRFTPYLSGGAGVSFRSTCTIGLTDGATGASSSTSCSDAARLSGGTFEFGPTDVGVLVGAGALIRAGAAAAQLGVRYEHGLLAEQQRTDIKGRLVSLTAGVSWPLGF
jgi:hypothetical protein